MVRMCVATASRLVELAGSDQGEMGPSYIVLLGVASSVLFVGATLLRSPFHWLVSVVGR
jgi:hypothetical protein